MIERIERDRLAQLLENISTGQIDEAEFLRGLPEDSRDRAVIEISDQAYWISPELAREDSRKEIRRWILFLQTDLEYEWPSVPSETGFLKSLAVGTLAALLLGTLALLVLESLVAFFASVMLSYVTAILCPVLRGRMQEERYDRAGDQDVWPFIRRSDYEQALGNPQRPGR